MSLLQMAYFSRNTLQGASAAQLGELGRILTVARRENAARAITGALVFDTTWFLQALEGPEEAVLGTYARIARDRRHKLPVVIGQRAREDRSFPRWAMAAALRSDFSDAVFREHGLADRLDPRRLTLDSAISLLVTLGQRAEARSSAA